MESEQRDLSTTDERSMVLAELSNRHVKLYKELFGRGPTKARTRFFGRDGLICTLENSMTLAERKLVEMGEKQRMRDTRTYFQHASEDDFVAAVEDITGRKVRAFVSGMDVEADLASEVYYLEPEVPFEDGHPPAD
jgi:uncharacterized protein YbcI